MSEPEEDIQEEQDDDLGEHRPGTRTGPAKSASRGVAQAGPSHTHAFHGRISASLKGGRGSKQRQEHIVPTLTNELFDRAPVENNYNRR